MNELQDKQLNIDGFAYQDLVGLDMWSPWTPVRTSWTDVGTITVTALFHFIGKQCFFQIQIVPQTSIAVTAGTSYVSLPKAAAGIGGMAQMDDLTAKTTVGACVIDTANSRVYTASQTASGHTFQISGWYQV